MSETCSRKSGLSAMKISDAPLGAGRRSYRNESPEQIAAKLKEAASDLADSLRIGQGCSQKLGISPQIFHRPSGAARGRGWRVPRYPCGGRPREHRGRSAYPSCRRRPTSRRTGPRGFEGEKATSSSWSCWSVCPPTGYSGRRRSYPLRLGGRSCGGRRPRRGAPGRRPPGPPAEGAQALLG